MRKQELKKIVLDRLTSHYTKSVITVLVKILDLIRVDDWRRDNVENFATKPITLSKLAFLTNLSEETVRKAIHILRKDGIIGQSIPASYSVMNPDNVKLLASKFLTQRQRRSEKRIVHKVRMRLERRLKKQIVFPL